MTDKHMIELWEERAAIMEYCGGMERRAADRAAYFELRRIIGPGVAVPAVIREAARLIRENELGTMQDAPPVD